MANFFWKMLGTYAIYKFLFGEHHNDDSQNFMNNSSSHNHCNDCHCDDYGYDTHDDLDNYSNPGGFDYDSYDYNNYDSTDYLDNDIFDDIDHDMW